MSFKGSQLPDVKTVSGLPIQSGVFYERCSWNIRAQFRGSKAKGRSDALTPRQMGFCSLDPLVAKEQALFVYVSEGILMTLVCVKRLELRLLSARRAPSGGRGA